MKTWAYTRSLLKKQFAGMGVTRCEVCSGTFALGFAHRYKRRFIQTDAELRTVALLCVKCHETIEFKGHDLMKAAIDKIISNRITEPMW